MIHWVHDTRETMVWWFEREWYEIKYGTKVKVHEGQAAIFVHEVQLAYVFTPGLYMLEIIYMPLIAILNHWDYGLKNPFVLKISLIP